MNRSFPTLPPRQRQVFSAILSLPGHGLNWYARTLGMACSTVEQAVRRLGRLELVHTRWDGHTRRCWPAKWTVA